MTTSCFNPRTPCGVRRQKSILLSLAFKFQSTHSLRSATAWLQWDNAQAPVSIHALLAECDHRQVGIQLGTDCFNPRTPCGVRPPPSGHSTWYRLFQSTHSLRSATFYEGAGLYAYVVSIHALLAECDQRGQNVPGQDIVSIHALLAECDILIMIFLYSPSRFNPRTPCGVRPTLRATLKQSWKFQSTHSLRSATRCGRRSFSGLLCFNPRTPCGVRQHVHGRMSRVCGFNPRTPCGVRPDAGGMRDLRGGFQSTHSLRSATSIFPCAVTGSPVSIHALLAECDKLKASKGQPGQRFNPRTPCGVRLFRPPLLSDAGGFNPRTPCGVRPALADLDMIHMWVSIHALLAECDLL